MTENGHAHNPLTLCSVPTCTCKCTGVGAHTKGDPQECSAEERYNNNNSSCGLNFFFFIESKSEPESRLPCRKDKDDGGQGGHDGVNVITQGRQSEQFSSGRRHAADLVGVIEATCIVVAVVVMHALVKVVSIKVVAMVSVEVVAWRALAVGVVVLFVAGTVLLQF